jgi:hypothetical protein
VPILTNYDLVATVGWRQAVRKGHVVSVEDGHLDIGFRRGSAEPAEVSVIEVEPAT